MIAVLGSSGFIGSAVLRTLAARRSRLRAVSRSRPAALPPGSAIEQRQIDLLVPGQARAAIEDADVIVHLVAHAASGSTWRSATADPEAERVNVGLMRDLVAAIHDRRVSTTPVLIYASTAQAAEPAAASRYAQQKLEAERILREASNAGLVRGLTLRLPTVYGQRDRSDPVGRGVVAAAIRQAISGQQLTMWHDGSVRRNLLHVEDVASAFAAALEHRDALAGETWTLGADRSESIGRIFAGIAESVARQGGMPPVPVVTVPAPEHAQPNDFRSDDIDSTAFRTHTQWRPQVPLWEGIERTVAASIPAKDRQ
ncbi:NAD(P)-dependent oxidoreductase [Rhodococcus sp. ABRD24]|nr:NAD(P)-dependent oxidoreductase [Rhodococcus sp. ABRD24]